MTLFIKSCSEPYCKEEYCESFDEEYEKRLEKYSFPLTPFPQNLTPKPIFVDSSTRNYYNLPYIYFKDEYGVWLRYTDAGNYPLDYFIQKEMPEDYYLYSDMISPMPKKNPKYFSESFRSVKLSENSNDIYKQYAHCVTRQDITHFDLHSNAGTSQCFPNGIYENIKKIGELQAPIAGMDIPQKVNFFSDKYKKIYSGKITGNQIVNAENGNIFEINTNEGVQKIRRYYTSETTSLKKMICAKELCLFFSTSPSHNYCEEIKNNTHVYVIKTDKKFSSLSQSVDSGNINHFGLKEGYTADDIVSFELIPTRFERVPRENEKDKRKFWDNQHELFVYAKDGTVINQYCEKYMTYKPIRTLPYNE